MVDSVSTTDKDGLRARLLAARRAVAEEVQVAEAQALTDHLAGLVGPAGGTVCGYLPVGSEPGSIAMLDALRGRGLRVLLPIARTTDDGVPQPLCWGEYQPGELVAARFGLREPGGPPLPPTVLAEADLVLVPALAVDRRGTRLGRGGGFYDRSLPLADPGARLMAVVRDDEVLDILPSESHDVPMTDVLTPNRGARRVNTGMPDTK